MLARWPCSDCRFAAQELYQSEWCQLQLLCESDWNKTKKETLHDYSTSYCLVYWGVGAAKRLLHLSCLWYLPNTRGSVNSVSVIPRDATVIEGCLSIVLELEPSQPI